MTPYCEVKNQRNAFGLPVPLSPILPDPNGNDVEMVTEEYEELIEAIACGDMVKIADGIADSIWVLCALAIACGLPLPAIWQEVYKTNMAKLGPDGKPIFNSSGKYIKPPGWVGPDIEGILRRHGWQAEAKALEGGG